MARRFDLIVFDWDGTLVDSIDWIVYCLQKAAGEYGCNVPEKQAAKDIIGLSIQRAMETLFPGTDQKTQEQLIACYSKQFFSKQITEDDLFRGVSEMLKMNKLTTVALIFSLCFSTSLFWGIPSFAEQQGGSIIHDYDDQYEVSHRVIHQP